MTDTFGTPVFLNAFSNPIPEYTTAAEGPESTLPSSGDLSVSTQSLSETNPPPIRAPVRQEGTQPTKTYMEAFKGVRQDSGDPVYFVKMVRDFYDQHGITDKKTIVFSDSLNIQLCLEYKTIAEEAGFVPVFGVGTFLTSKSSQTGILKHLLTSNVDDFAHLSDGKKSVPLNIVIKVSSAGGRPAVKLSDNLGKNTGDQATVVEVKKRLGYVERDWESGDETRRWGKKGD